MATSEADATQGSHVRSGVYFLLAVLGSHGVVVRLKRLYGGINPRTEAHQSHGLVLCAQVMFFINLES